MEPRTNRTTAGRRSRHISRAMAVPLAVVLAGLAQACAFNRRPSNPDPANKHLSELAADPIFATLPPNAAAVGALLRSPARQTSALGGHVWHGPSVTMTFTSTQTPGSVFTYYANLAKSEGWVPNGNKNVLDYPEDWDKTYPGGTHATLSLIDMDIRAVIPGRASTYILNGSA